MGQSQSLYCACLLTRGRTQHCCVWRHPSISDLAFAGSPMQRAWDSALVFRSKLSTFDDSRTHNFLGVFRVRGIKKSLKRFVREKWVIHNERLCYKSFSLHNCRYTFSSTAAYGPRRVHTSSSTRQKPFYYFREEILGLLCAIVEGSLNSHFSSRLGGWFLHPALRA